MIYILSDTKVAGAISLPLIEQHFFTPSIDFERYDYLIFTSKNGVRAAQKIDEKWKRIPSLAIGEATAREIKRLGGSLVYVATRFYGDQLAQEIIERCDPKKHYLYLRPKVVASDLTQRLLAAGFLLEEVVVYETRCRACHEVQPPPQGATIIFSSPSTVRCFFRCFSWDASYKAIAIGKRTAAAFGGKIAIAPKPTLQAAVEFATTQGFTI